MIQAFPMSVQQFVEIMSQNSDIYPAFAKLTDEQKIQLAKINLSTGTAQSFLEHGKLVAVGGIRFKGIGEAWLISPPDIREQRGISLFRKTNEVFIETRDNENLWRVFATSEISKSFLKHLQFKDEEKILVWTRT